MKQLIFLLCMLFAFSQLSYSQTLVKETVYLKNGSIIKGIVIEHIPEKSIKIQTADGSIFVYKTDEVEKITKDIITRPNNRNVKPQSSPNTLLDYSGNDYSGYRGFVDFGYTIGTGDYNLGRLELTTSHGYHFNPYIFLGAGTGFHYYCTDEADEFVIPVFADFRANFIKGPIVPFATLKLGYSFTTSEFDNLGVYLAPAIGVKFMLHNKQALSVSLGYTCQWTKIDEYYEYDPYSSYPHYYSGTLNLSGLSLKLGFEF